MREIKFRGKCLSSGEWLYGYYGCKELSNEHFIIEPTFNSSGNFEVQYFTDNLIVPSTVGQYTGLKDKNGVEIYEGDVLGWETGNVIVKFGGHETSGFDYYSSSAYGYYMECSDGREFSLENEYNVIGNIYDNKELLEG